MTERIPTSADAGPLYQQDMQWLDPDGRSWVMRNTGGGHAVWLAEDPSARLIDEIGGVAPVAAYATLRLAAGYEGPALTVVNGAKKTALDVKFLADGTLDEETLSAFCAHGPCRLSRWFDQSGHGNDAVQPDPAAQPVIRMAHRTGKPLSVILDYEATSGAAPQWLILPTTLAIDSGSMAVLWTGRFHNASMVSPVVELGTDADPFNFGYWDAHGDFYLGTRDHLGELIGHAPLTASVGMISSSQQEGLVTNFRNQLIARGKLPPEPHRGGFIGQTSVYKANGSMELSSFVLYARGLSPMERFAAVKTLGENFRIPQQQQDTYVADGDSLTQGIASQYLQSYPFYMERLLPASLLVYDAGWATKMLGGPGGLLSRYGEFTSKLYNADARRNIISIFAGTNDLQNGVDDREVLRLLQQYAAAARKTGFKVVIATILPRATFSPKAEQSRLAVNAALRNHWREIADAVADLAADPALGDPKAQPNSVVYSEDGIHLTDLGYQIVASIMAAAVTPLAR